MTINGESRTAHSSQNKTGQNSMSLRILNITLRTLTASHFFISNSIRLPKKSIKNSIFKMPKQKLKFKISSHQEPRPTGTYPDKNSNNKLVKTTIHHKFHKIQLNQKTTQSCPPTHYRYKDKNVYMGLAPFKLANAMRMIRKKDLTVSKHTVAY